MRFESVSKSYVKGQTIVENFSLDIHRGEFLTLLGPSGSGKTTTLMLLAGFQLPSQGNIYLDGRNITTIPPYARNIGVVFQNYSLFPHMTVAENIAFPLKRRRYGKRAAAAKVEDMLTLVRLNGLGARKPRELSGGQQQRVALARALAFDPQIVLMDEPLGALDKKLREEMQLEIKRLHDKLAFTAVYVTHDQEEALVMSDRIAVLDGGKIEQIGPPIELYERPATIFVARFIGDGNNFVGTVMEVNGVGCLVCTDGGLQIRATLTSRLNVGERALVSVRPEHVALGMSNGSNENGCAVTIREHIYLGNRIKLKGLTESGEDITVDAPVAVVRDGAMPGTRVPMRWSAEAARAFAFTRSHTETPQGAPLAFTGAARGNA